MKIFLPFFLLLFSFPGMATRITGVVTDESGQPLAYASILVKGTSTGTVSGENGFYFLDLPLGTYEISCQYVGYIRSERKIDVSNETITVDFRLKKQVLSLEEVIVTPGAEDPAYEIMRQAIRKRNDYAAPLDAFTCESYIKTLIKTEKIPDRIFGQKIKQKDKEEMGVDSAGKGVMFLSESITRIAFRKPDDIKLEVISGRESGSSGYGFNFPSFIDFYSNQVNVFSSQLNPRGFVSPVAESAMSFYRYKYLGSFVEDGREIHEIEVIPRRKYEPVFSGNIRITEGDWRIHSLELLLTKTSQLEIMDSLHIRQLQVPVSKEVWRTKDQMVRFRFSQFGITATGSFLNVYNNYDLNPRFPENYFNRTIVKYDTSVNKRSRAYWDSIRPVPLETEELKDYSVKDSLFDARQDSGWQYRNRDSLLKRQGSISVQQVLVSGFSRSNFRQPHPVQYGITGLTKGVRYNTVEGVSLEAQGFISRRLNNADIRLEPHVRYGFTNRHLNTWGELRYKKLEINKTGEPAKPTATLAFSAGKTIQQFNKENPISDLMNAAYTLISRKNYMKLYEAWFGELNWKKKWESSFTLETALRFEDRLPLENRAFSSWYSDEKRDFTPNYPVEQLNAQFTRHQSANLMMAASFQPGQRFIEYPRRKVSIGSQYPVFSIRYEKGIPDLLGSESDFDKWRFSVSDDLNLKLKGLLKYRFNVGGFLNDNHVFIQDFRHFNGNQTLLAGEYLNSFQLAPYYANSTTASFYTSAHLEHHLNGMLTNKIPLFRKLNWNLVGGANAFYVNGNNHYVEAFGGIENIFKVLRIDVVGSWLNGNTGMVGFRFGLGGIIGGALQVR